MQSNIKLVHEVRAVKTKKELVNIIKAQRISERVLIETIGKLKTGIREVDVVKIIYKAFVKEKAAVLAFMPIVAFGKNSANIHHAPNKTRLKIGDIVMFDFGTTINHYCSDMSRTYFWGRPTKKQQKVYVAVLEAQERAIKKILSGERRAKIIDKVARDFLSRRFGKNNFQHGLGHGIGTVIHEWPNFKPASQDILPAGCVMTVEPGIYLRNFGGIRIEDMVYVTKDGCKNLTNVAKTLQNAILEPK